MRRDRWEALREIGEHKAVWLVVEHTRIVIGVISDVIVWSIEFCTSMFSRLVVGHVWWAILWNGRKRRDVIDKPRVYLHVPACFCVPNGDLLY